MTLKRVLDTSHTVAQLERSLATLSACSCVLVRATGEAELMGDICRVIVDECGYRMAWIGFARQDEQRRVMPMAQAGYDDGYLETLRISWHDNERGRGPTGTAIRTGRTVIARNILEDPSFAPWREDAAKRGYASSIALPLKLRDGTIGSLNIYSEAPDAFDVGEERLLAEIAENLGLGLSALRGEEARARAEARLRRVVENMPVLMDAFDEDGGIVLWNRAAEELTGYRAEEIIDNEKALELLYPDGEYRERMLEEWQRRGDDYVGWQWDLTTKDGSRRTVEWSNISDRYPISGWRSWGVGIDVTERLETERRLRDLFENVPVGLWVEDFSAVRRIIVELEGESDGDWRAYFGEHPEVVERCAAAVEVVDVNAAALAVHGAQSKQELLGNLDRVFSDESMRTFFEELVCLAQGKNEFRGEGQTLTLAGDPVWIDIHLRIAPGHEKDWSRVLVSTTDVSARRAAENDLARELSLLENLAEFEARVRAQATRDLLPGALEFLKEEIAVPHSSLALIEPDGEALRIAFLEEGVGTLTQGRRLPLSSTVLSEVIGEAKARYRPDLRAEPTDYEVDRELIAAGYLSDFLIPLMHEGRCIGTLNCASSEVDGFAEDTRRLLSLLAPRLAQHIANARLFDDLKMSEERFRSLVSNLPGAVYRRSADESWAALYVSDEMEKLTGHPSSAFLGAGGRSYASLIHPGDLAAVRRVVADGIEHRSPYVSEHRIVTSGGEVKWVNEKGRASYAADGTPLWLDGLIVDVTERRRLEEEVLKSQKLESLGVLAGGIAHDFNNILMGVLGGTDLAARQLPVSSPARRHLDDVATAAHRAADLANQLLAYSGKGSFVVEAVDLSELVEEMSHLVEAAVSKKVRITFDLDRNLPAIEVDVTQIRQIALNLVTNAAEATGNASGVVSIRTGSRHCDREYLERAFSARQLEPGRYVVMQVLDTGRGMDEKTRGKIFDPFYSTKATGRGLGLAAALGIVRGHRGAIRVESELGRGTTISILFPASAESAVSRADPEDVGAWSGNGTVLVVDDEETVRSVAAAMLRSLGFEVMVAADGREGVEMFRSHGGKIVLVLLDLAMPEMSGDEALREIRRLDSDVKVLLSSGYHEQETSRRLAECGPASFIQKPYRLAELGRKIREALES